MMFPSEKATNVMSHDRHRGGPHHHWWSSMRARTVLTALIIVAVALGASSVVLIVQINSSQLGAVDGALRIELNSLMSLARGGTLPNPLQVASQDTSFLGASGFSVGNQR